MLPVFFHQTPFFRLLLPWVAGMVVGFGFPVPAGYCISVCVVFAVGVGFLLKRWKRLSAYLWRWLFGVCLNIFLLFAGIGMVSLRPTVATQPAEHGVWMVVVDEPPAEKENSMQATLHIRANLTHEAISCDERVMAYFRKDSLSRRIRQGDLLVITATLNPIINAGNPYEFDYRGFLKRRNIGRSAFVECGHWQLLDCYAQGSLRNLANQIRNRLLDIFKRSGLSGHELSVASALVLGYKADLDDTLRRAYAASGAMHVLAVSGLHVGIVYVILTMILKLIPILYRIKWLRALLLLTALWLFALITGLSPSVMRAATMFSFIAAGDALRRRAYIYNSIAASAFILLLINPINLFEVGFQLSYLAVIAIVFLHPFFYGLLSFDHRLADAAWNLTCVSVAAQIGTAPVAVFYFHQLPVYFILSNFVVIPAATVIIYGAMLLFVVSPVPILLEAVGWLLDKFVYLVNFCIFFIEKLPGSVLLGIRFAGWEVLMAYALVAAVSIWILMKRSTALPAVLALMTLWAAGVTVGAGRDLQRQQLIVYHTQGNSLLQFVDGRENVIWYAGRSPSFNVSAFTEDQHTAMHLRYSQYIHLDSALRTKSESYLRELYHDGNFVQFAGQRLVIFTRDMPPQEAHRSPVHTDVAILTQNVNAHIRQIVESYHPAMVVMDASNSKARLDRWEKECVEAKLPYHRVDRDGAFVWGMKN